MGAAAASGSVFALRSDLLSQIIDLFLASIR